MRTPQHFTLRYLLIAICTLFICEVRAQQQDTPLKQIELLLDEFDTSTRIRHTDNGNQVIAMLLQQGFGDDIRFTADVPHDTINMTVWYYAAEYFLTCQQYEKCVKYAGKALPLTENNGDYTWKLETLNLLTQGYFHLSDLVHALNYGEQLYDLDSRYDDYARQSSTLNTLAAIYLMGRQGEEALNLSLKAIEADSKASSHEHVSAIYGIASESYIACGKPKEALNYATKAYEIDMHANNPAKAAIRQSQMAAAYLQLNDTERARQLLEQAIPVLQQSGNATSLGIGLNTLGKALNTEGRYDEAISHLKQAYSIFAQTGDDYNRTQSLYALVTSYSKSDPRQAMAYMDQYVMLRDSLYHDDMKRMLSNYSAKMQNDELSDENATVRRTNRLLIYGSLLTMGVLLLGIIFLFYAIRQKKRSNTFLRETQQARHSFFTNVTNEFHTPLTVILGMAERLQSDENIDKALASDVIEREGKRMLSLVDQLIGLSKNMTTVPEADAGQETAVDPVSMVEEYQKMGTRTRIQAESDRKFIAHLTDLVCAHMKYGTVDVDSIAKALKTSPAQLRRRVTAITGSTPASYFLQIRLSNAQRIIDANPGISISEVAMLCGFADGAHFSHAFQKAFGMSPSQYAKRAK